jgi:hypothetical protein
LATACGYTSKKNTIQAKTGRATKTVNQISLKKNQLPAIRLIPVRRIDQGWHHQGL